MQTTGCCELFLYLKIHKKKYFSLLQFLIRVLVEVLCVPWSSLTVTNLGLVWKQLSLPMPGWSNQTSRLHSTYRSFILYRSEASRQRIYKQCRRTS